MEWGGGKRLPKCFPCFSLLSDGGIGERRRRGKPLGLRGLPDNQKKGEGSTCPRLYCRISLVVPSKDLVSLSGLWVLTKCFPCFSLLSDGGIGERRRRGKPLGLRGLPDNQKKGEGSTCPRLYCRISLVVPSKDLVSVSGLWVLTIGMGKEAQHLPCRMRR